MSEILLGQSYFLQFDPKLWEAMQPYPPLGALYAASYLRKCGYDVALFDAMLAASEDEWGRALERERPKYAVLYEDNFNYLSKMCLLRMRKAALTMIGLARATGCTVIVGGSDATDHAAEYIAYGADFVLLGEGEATLAELLDHLSGRIQTPVQAIMGLAYRAGAEGAIHLNPRRPDIKTVDELPFPAWDLVDVEAYRRVWTERHGYFSMNMVTTRGCPFHCNWCAKPIWGQRYNARSPRNVVAEMRWLKDTYRPDYIWFADDIVGLKPGWWREFAEQVALQDTMVPFKCLSRVDLLLRPGEVEALRKAGCQIVWVGAESGSQKILDAMEKGTRVEQIYEVAERLHAAGVKVGFFLQFGYPGETRDDIELTLQMVAECRPDDIGMSVSYPLPGTKFYERVKGQLGTKQNWQDSSDLAMLYAGPYATDFYRQLHVTLHKQYRAARSKRELADVVRRPGQMRPRHLRQAAAMVYHTVTLPSARRRLDRLEHAPHAGAFVLPSGMSQQAAATPTPQAD